MKKRCPRCLRLGSREICYCINESDERAAEVRRQNQLSADLDAGRGKCPRCGQHFKDIEEAWDHMGACPQDWEET